jgi:AcrR family transcriptional regulator
MAQAAQLVSEPTDPRILRSRRMLMDALAKLLTQKEFDNISVQEIADEATLNRATFYLHYPDKGALLEAMTEFRFRELIERRGIAFTNCDSALRAIACGLLDYLTEVTGCPIRTERIPLEGSIIPVLEGMFKAGFARHELRKGVDADMVATTAAWAMFGAARRWFQTPDRIPTEEMATKIEALVKPFLANATQ